jgi:hypothetical protein
MYAERQDDLPFLGIVMTIFREMFLFTDQSTSGRGGFEFCALSLLKFR